MTITERYVNSKELEGKKKKRSIKINNVDLLNQNRQQASIKLSLK